jgi:hypothetical protein
MSYRPLLIHEFLDRRLDNVIGVPGQIISSTPPPTVRPGSSSIEPGRWFVYALDRQQPSVIGIDVKVRIHAPTQGAGAFLPEIIMGNAMRVGLRFTDPLVVVMIDGNLVARSELRVSVGGQEVVWTINLPHRMPINLHISWHTSGPLRMSVDGRLQAYSRAIAPLARLSISDIFVGNPQPTDGIPVARFYLQYLSIRTLQEEDAFREVVAELPLRFPDELPESRCAKLVTQYQRDLMMLLHGFMSAFIRETSTDWELTATDPEPNFSPAALAAHTNAVDAFDGLMRFVRRHEASGRAQYLTSIAAFFTQLRNVLPDQYAQLLDAIEQLPLPPRECFELAESFVDDNAELVESMRQLNRATIRLARSQ